MGVNKSSDFGGGAPAYLRSAFI